VDRSVSTFFSRTRVSLFVVDVGALLVHCGPLIACIPVGPPWDTPYMMTEDTAIVWDSQNHIEHFIRAVGFDTHGDNLGFIVPTPSRPTLAPVDLDSFDDIAGVAAPPVHVVRTVDVGWFGDEGKGILAAAVSSRPEILNQQMVGPWKATVLRATDTNGLSRWLNINGFVMNAAGRKWASGYVRKHWIFTAYRFTASVAHADAIGAPAIDMSFHTDAPFYPYSEPKSRSYPGSRTLVVNLFDAGRDVAVHPDAGAPQWAGHVVYSEPLSKTSALYLRSSLGFDKRRLPAGMRLTIFEDGTSDRTGLEDLIFRPSTDQRAVAPEPIEDDETVWITPWAAYPWIARLIFLVAAFACFWLIKKAYSVVKSRT
jgi:hypothetical protein